MPLYTLYIVNKAGGLIYNRVRCWRRAGVATLVADAGCFPGSQDLSNVPKLPNNMYLRMASIFHSLHAISSQVGAHYRTTTVAMRG